MPKRNQKGVIIVSALELDILTVLNKDELYGLAIKERINKARSKVGMNKLGIGSLYPSLKRMEEAKLIKGEFREPVEGEDSPRRKYYKLLAEGETAISRTHAYRKLLKQEEGTLIPDGRTSPNTLRFLVELEWE